jgi:hypothetical protein
MTLIKKNISGWNWHIPDPSIIEAWFANFAKAPEAAAQKIKANPVRTVWKINDYYIKHNHPRRKRDKLRFFFFPKAKSEFKSAKILDKEKIPAIKSIGWASKKDESILLSESMEGFVNAREFWFQTASKNQKMKSAFLLNLSELAGLLVRKKITHPDFHLGNLLVNPNGCALALVDVYGVKKRAKLSEKSKLKTLGIIASMRGEISDEEACDFLHGTKTLLKSDEPIILWMRLLSLETRELAKMWKKRRKLIFQDGKFSRRFERDNGFLLIKKDICGISRAKQENFESNQTDFDVFETNADNAMKAWEKSFFLDFSRIRHRGPLAIEIKPGKALMFYDNRCPTDSPALSKSELIRRCTASNIPKKILEKIISNSIIN